MAKISKKLLAWRKKQTPGSIMKPETFEKIKTGAKKRYGIGEERASRVAGKAYWKTVKAKGPHSKTTWGESNIGIQKLIGS